jgi:hypothetical protein
MPLFYVTAFVCIVNSATSLNSRLVPPSSQPVQGSRPEVPRRDLAPYFCSTTSGLFSHQYPRICITRTHLLSTTFRHLLTLFSHHSRTLRPRTLISILSPSFAPPLPALTRFESLQARHITIYLSKDVIEPKFDKSSVSFLFRLLVLILWLRPYHTPQSSTYTHRVPTEVSLYLHSTLYTSYPQENKNRIWKIVRTKNGR